MDTTFNFNRFLKVLSNEWRLNWMKMASFWGVATILATIVFVVHFFDGSDLVNRPNFLGLPLILAPLLQGMYLQFYFNEFSSKKKTQALLLLPASQNETFWAKFLLSVVVYILLVVFYIWVMLEGSKMLNVWLWENGVAEMHPALYFELRQDLMFGELGTFYKILSLIWIFSVPAYLIGLFTFKKNPIFTSFILWIVVIVLLGYLICTVYFLFTGVFPSFASIGIIFGINDDVIVLYSMYPNLMIGAVIFISLALMVIARVKYNEKTI